MDNRMNTAAGVVGIIQPTGRPFGDLPMATLATERLLQLDGGEGYEQRDLGVLLFHDGKHKAGGGCSVRTTINGASTRLF